MEIFSNILIYFVIVPVLTLAGLALCSNKGIKAIRTVAVAGASVLVALAIYLVYLFLQARGAGDTSEMILRTDVMWFAPFNIKLALGVDGISVVMILLSAFIVFAGVFASWRMNPLPKQFFLWFYLLSTGVFGFFISIDLFTMFMFYEVALIPMYLLIGVWGSGSKNYSAMKLTLMLMGGSAFLMLGLIGIYFHSSADGNLTMNVLEIARNNAIPHQWQMWLFPLTFIGFGVLGAMFPFHTWSPDGHASAPTAVSMLHAGVLMKLGGYGCFRIAIYLMPFAANMLAWIFLTLTGVSIVYGAFSACVVQHHRHDRRGAADALAWSDDGLVLCLDWYDLRTHSHARHPRHGWHDDHHALFGCGLCDSWYGFAGSAGTEWFRCRDDHLLRLV